LHYRERIRIEWGGAALRALEVAEHEIEAARSEALKAGDKPVHAFLTEVSRVLERNLQRRMNA